MFWGYDFEANSDISLGLPSLVCRGGLFHLVGRHSEPDPWNATRRGSLVGPRHSRRGLHWHRSVVPNDLHQAQSRLILRPTIVEWLALRKLRPTSRPTSRTKAQCSFTTTALRLSGRFDYQPRKLERRRPN